MPLTACTESDPVTNPPVSKEPVQIERGTFAKGADVSWLTQLEMEGYKFYTAEKVETECMQLLRDECGVNSIRLRVWVNPEEGWNNINDVVVKARRANSLGMRLMIDFHFSDTWADPGNQSIPAEWENLDLTGMKNAISSHVTEMLTRLKDLGIEPEWVQIGNETTPGMLLPIGSVDNPVQLTELNNTGYEAAKSVFPDVKTIVHLDSGNDQWRYDRMFDILESNGGKYDMIGMSVYPYWAEEEGYQGGWSAVADETIANINHLREKYNKPVMICEIGMPYNQAELCKRLIEKMMTASIEGIFYWEPEAPAGYNDGYQMGCFEDSTPTCALDPFKDI